jgi:DNA-binding winged helix-turn-helix (wHTH) protein
MSLRFGNCVLDAETRQVLRADVPVPLTPKAFQLLEFLVSRRPRAVSKPEIYEHLWPHTFVSEVNLARLMFEIREALGDQARQPKYVRTVRGFGYAFCGTATESAGPVPASPSATVSCWLIWGDKEYPLREGENVVGRTGGSEVRIDSTSVSRQHARIVLRGENATVEDLDSKNGTKVGGKKSQGLVNLADGDVLRFGSVTVTFRIVPPEAPTRTARDEEA